VLLSLKSWPFRDEPAFSNVKMPIGFRTKDDFRHPYSMLAVGSCAMFLRRVTRRTLVTLLWIAWACWAAAILGLSSMTREEMPSVAFVTWDKFNHFIAFLVGGWLAASALRCSRPHLPAAGRIALATAIVAAFGALDEALQTFTPGRTGGDFYDWIADFLGAIGGALLTFRTHGPLERFLKSP